MELIPLFVNVLALVAMAFGLAIAAWFVVGLFWVHSRREEQELPEVELPGNVHEVFAAVPPVLVAFFLFIALSAVAYVLYIWLGGITY